MYTKLRFLAGSQTQGERATAALKILFERFAADPGFAAGGPRNEDEAGSRGRAGEEFQVFSRSDLRHRFHHQLPAGEAWRGGQAREVCATGCGAAWRRACWTRADAGVLDHAAELLRTVEHVARLVVGRAVKWLPATEHGREVTEKLTGQILGREFPDGLESELDRTFGRVRAIYERVLEWSRRGIACGCPRRLRPACGTMASRQLIRVSPPICVRQIWRCQPAAVAGESPATTSNLSGQFLRRV